MKVFLHLFLSNLKYNKLELGISYFITAVVIVFVHIFRDTKSTDADFLFSIAFYAMLYAFYTNRRKFNLKYLLSLPLSKSQLIMAKTSSDFVYFVPAVICAFTGVMYSPIEFSAFPLLIILFQVVMFVAFIIFDSDIEQPRLENAKSSFLNRLIYMRKGMDFIFFGVFVIYLALAIHVTPLEMFVKQYLIIIVLSLSLGYKFQRTLNLLKDESYSYFMPRRDLFSIGKKISLFGIIGVLFMISGLSMPSKYGEEKFYSAIQSKDKKNLEKKLSHIKKIKVSKSGYTPITAAISEGNVEALRILDSLGFPVHLDDKLKTEEETYLPIHLAINSGNVEMIDYIVRKLPESMEAKTEKNQFSGLHLASINCKPEAIDYLTSKKINLNAKDPKGNTALIYSAKANCIPAMAILLEAGANPLFKNLQEKTASNYLRNKKDKYLLKRKELQIESRLNRELASEK